MRLSILMVIGSAVLSSAVLAGEPLSAASSAPPQAQSFAALDANRDGQLSFSEAFANPQLSNNFNALDTNADGQLSRGEVSGVIR